MFLPSHLASGYILGKFIKRPLWSIFPFMPVLLIASIFPDLDGVWSETVAGHHSILHTPICWIVIFGIMGFLGRITQNKKIKPISLGIFLGTQMHLLTDWVTARTVGIKWFYPFNKTDYFLYQIQPEQGEVPVWEMVQSPYFSFYMENSFLFWAEIGLLFLTAIILYRNRLRVVDE
ncbi:MAG: metal-dependent hydrolase [Fidelibacterota bacterium]